MIQVYALHDYDKDLKRRGCFPISQNDAANYNEQGYGIFFTPNDFIGSRVENNLSSLNMWFIDMDKGSKEVMEKMILEFPLEPSLLIETRSGFHCYWKCEPQLFEDGLVEDYLEILSDLVDYFHADKNAMGTNRVLRVPGFYHCKDEFKKFLVKEVYRTSSVYTVEQMKNALPDKSEKVKELKSEKEKDFFKQVPHDDFWQKVFNLDCEKYLPLLSGSPECNGENFHVERYGSKGKIFVNGDLIQSCWIDSDGKIGSHANGGPSLANWIRWYGHEWDSVAKCLKRCIPELEQAIKLPESFAW